jgi:hypothetical protein
VRTDPTDNGGLFIGRRPGTKPVRYRDTPERGTSRRQHVDGLIAGLLLLLMGLICLSFWGPLPAGWLWVGGRVQYWTNSVSAGIFAAFAGLMGCLMLGLVICKRLDSVWILARRAAGHDQREGAVAKVFGITCAIGAAIFTGWLLLFSGASLTGGGVSL